MVMAFLAALLLVATSLRGAVVVPEELPDPLIPGFVFPESEATIMGWITAMTGGVRRRSGFCHLTR